MRHTEKGVGAKNTPTMILLFTSGTQIFQGKIQEKKIRREQRWEGNNYFQKKI